MKSIFLKIALFSTFFLLQNRTMVCSAIVLTGNDIDTICGRFNHALRQGVSKGYQLYVYYEFIITLFCERLSKICFKYLFIVQKVIIAINLSPDSIVFFISKYEN